MNKFETYEEPNNLEKKLFLYENAQERLILPDILKMIEEYNERNDHEKILELQQSYSYFVEKNNLMIEDINHEIDCQIEIKRNNLAKILSENLKFDKLDDDTKIGPIGKILLEKIKDLEDSKIALMEDPYK